jgi:hypothetical protein
VTVAELTKAAKMPEKQRRRKTDVNLTPTHNPRLLSPHTEIQDEKQYTCYAFGCEQDAETGERFIIIIIMITTTQRIAFGIEAVMGRFTRCTGEQARR